MAEKIVVGPIQSGLKLDVLPFNIDNGSFPQLFNAYQWRGRVKRKRGTETLGRLTRYFNSAIPSYGSITTFNLAGGSGNILTSFSLETNGNIESGSLTLTVGANEYKDVLLGVKTLGILNGNPAGSGTINYATGAVTIVGGGAGAVTLVSFRYHPSLPVMGVEDLQLESDQFPLTLAFDTKYSYNVVTSSPYPNYDVSFYKNAAVSASLPGYVPKTNSTPVTWNGKDYQQFWTVNYEGALFATNGIPIPFASTNLGMQFNTISAVTIAAVVPPTTVTITTSTNHGLVIGDFVFINEIIGISGINFQTGYVTAIPALNQITVIFPNSSIAGAWISGGIVQYLTNRSDKTKDCMRWYDGDPTDGNETPTLTTGKGWVNFCPPLSQFDYNIANAPADQYYLINARMIVTFKDRLLFLGPVIQNSAGKVIYLQDTIVYSENGTPYYTASYVNNPTATIDTPTSSGNVFFPMLLPENQTSVSAAWFGDQTGFGGWISAGIAQPLTTVAANGDVLIVGFSSQKAKVVYTGDDIIPLNFYTINSEYGDASTFSSITTDSGVLTRGSRGYLITNQTNTQRFDLDIPDQVFQINLQNNGNERLCSVRDFIKEWIYFTYNANDIDSSTTKFPNETLMYNYRDESWAIFKETYTTYGAFRKQTGFTWATVGKTYPTWNDWTDPWDSAESTLLNQQVLAGNQQGFLIIRDVGIGEGESLYIKSINGAGNIITSPSHNLLNGDYIKIDNCIGNVGQFLNGRTFSVFNITENTFRLNPNPEITSQIYFGEGTITRIYFPQIQTKQFPVSWAMSRKTRIGPQQYLFTKTENSQITLQIFLSQNSSSAYNERFIEPDLLSTNGSLIYSNILYTCSESTNLGLTPANSNLQTPTAIQQSQLWHRMNTSLIGDTVQIGFTLSDEQIRSLEPISTTENITGATQSYPCVLNSTASFAAKTLILIKDVAGMFQLNNKVWQVISSTLTTVTINVDSTGFTAYTSGGNATPVANLNANAEIELHGFVLEVSPSQLLV